MKPSLKKWPVIIDKMFVSLIFTELHIKTKVRKFPDLKWRHKDSTLPPPTTPSQRSSENKESRKQNFKYPSSTKLSDI